MGVWATRVGFAFFLVDGRQGTSAWPMNGRPGVGAGGSAVPARELLHKNGG